VGVANLTSATSVCGYIRFPVGHVYSTGRSVPLRTGAESESGDDAGHCRELGNCLAGIDSGLVSAPCSLGWLPESTLAKRCEYKYPGEHDPEGEVKHLDNLAAKGAP
jgi:hypothetical protein